MSPSPLRRTFPALGLLGILFASAAGAQDAMDRAGAAVGSVGDPSGHFNATTVDDVVTPYETSTPAETNMDHNTFEDRILTTRQADNDQGRVLRATEESAIVRPNVEIDAQGPLLDDANWAHENAEDIAGKYFTSETGTCTEPNLPVTTKLDFFCESSPARETKTCELIRNIWIDRTDTYRCDVRTANFVKVCDKTNSYSCVVNSNANSCIRNNVNISGGTVTWNGNRATVALPTPVHPQEPAIGLHRTRWAALVKHPISISVSDRFQPSSVSIRRVDARGVAQVTKDGVPVGTYVNSRLGHFANPGANPYGTQCPSVANDGLLVAYTNTKISSHPNNRHMPEAWIMMRPHYYQPWLTNRWVSIVGSGPTVFESGHDVAEGIGPLYTWNGISTLFHQCVQYASLPANRNVVRDTLTFLDLNTFANARPVGPRRFRSTNLTARVVYETDVAQAGSAQLTFEFEGACCDRFRNNGDEQCQ